MDNIIDSLSTDYSSSDLLWAQFKSIQSSFFEQSGNKEAAISALRDSKDFYQSLYYQTDDREEVFSDYYESVLAERKLQLLEQQHELAGVELANSNRTNLMLSIGALVLVVLLALVTYLYIVQRRLKKEQETLATVDTLTGVRNRRSLLGAVQLEISKAKAYQNNLSLALIDLDNLKPSTTTTAMNAETIYLKRFASMYLTPLEKQILSDAMAEKSSFYAFQKPQLPKLKKL